MFQEPFVLVDVFISAFAIGKNANEDQMLSKLQVIWIQNLYFSIDYSIKVKKPGLFYYFLKTFFK